MIKLLQNSKKKASLNTNSFNPSPGAKVKGFVNLALRCEAWRAAGQDQPGHRARGCGTEMLFWL